MIFDIIEGWLEDIELTREVSRRWPGRIMCCRLEMTWRCPLVSYCVYIWCPGQQIDVGDLDPAVLDFGVPDLQNREAASSAIKISSPSERQSNGSAYNQRDFCCWIGFQMAEGCQNCRASLHLRRLTILLRLACEALGHKTPTT